MKKTNLIIVLLLILLNAFNSFSQEKNKNTIISISPQYIFVNGMRFDIEHQFKKSWIGISPTIYYRNTGDFFQNFYQNDYYPDNYSTQFDTIVGFGIEMYQKIFLKKFDIPVGFYFSYGLNYNFFKMYYHAYNWETSLEDGLEYINFVPAYKHHNINKFGANLLIGYQAELSTNLYLDMYTGVGMRLSSQQKDLLNTERFNDSSVDYGYSGPLLLLGFKLGVNL